LVLPPAGSKPLVKEPGFIQLQDTIVGLYLQGLLNVAAVGEFVEGLWNLAAAHAGAGQGVLQGRKRAASPAGECSS
jgi:hypothetical protein